jgi:WD40 repeat protein
MRADRVVPVIRAVGGERRVGSGYQVAGRFVLTAAHCVRGSGHRVWLPDGERDARVAADGSRDGIDLALLEITPAPGQKPAAEVTPTRCGRVDREVPGRIGGCVAVGYPKYAARREAPFTTGEVDGWIPAASGLADTATGRTGGFLTLKAEGAPPRPLPTGQSELGQSAWAGMSGAAVFARGLLIGVVAEQHLPEGEGSLTVVPIEWADRLTGVGRLQLLQALGVQSIAELQLTTAGAPDQRWASVVPYPPTALVERHELLAALRQALLAGDGKPVLATGMGGAGKSVLAAQLARAVRDGADAELAVAFPAGVAWVTVGRERPLSAAQLELATAFGEARPDLGGDWRSARLQLQQLAAGRRGLVVLDDVWTQDRYEPFGVDIPGVQILITTRNQALATDLGGTQVPVGELEPDQSRQLLATSADVQLSELPGEASQILSEVGHLALGVAMVGAIVAERGPRAWLSLQRRLRERQLDKIAYRFADSYQHATLLRAIEVAVDDLDARDQPRWAELAVFAEQGAVPESAMVALWQPFDSDDLDTGDRISRFLARSLLQRAGDGRYRLHDLQYNVALLRLGPRLAHTHSRLVDTYLHELARAANAPEQTGWADLISDLANRATSDPAWRIADDGYLLGHLVRHLRSANREQEVAQLLRDYDWVAMGLARRGVAGLVSDYDDLPARNPLKLVQHALTHSSRALSADPSCLPDQLLGRLAEAAETKDFALAPLLARVGTEQGRRPLEIILSGLQRPSGSLVNVLTGHQKAVTALAVTCNDTWAVSASQDGTAIVWDLATGARLHTLTGHQEAVTAVALTGDGTRAVTASQDGTAIVWDLATGARLHTLLTGHFQIQAIAVTGDGTRAVTASQDGTAMVWDLATGTPQRVLTGHHHQLRAIAVTSDGTRAVTSSQDGTAIVWDLATGARLHTFRSSDAAIAFTMDGSRVVTSNFGDTIVWDLATGTRLHTLEGNLENVTAVAITADCTRAVSASSDGTATTWDLATGARLHTFTGHQEAITAVALTDDGTRVVTGSQDGTAIVWDLASSPVPNHASHRQRVSAVAVTGDGTQAVTGSFDGTAIVWDLATGARLHTLTGHQEPVLAVAVTGDGTQAVTGSFDGTAIVWDLATGARLHTLTGHEEAITTLAVTGDGTRVVIGGEERPTTVWDLTTGRRLHTIPRRHGLGANEMAVTRDGTRAVTINSFQAAIVRDLRTGARLHTLADHQEGFTAVAVTGDNRAITGNKDGVAIVWDLINGAHLHTLTGHQKLVGAIAVTDDSTRALTASYDGTAMVWDLTTGARLHTLAGHQEAVVAVAVTLDGIRAVTASWDRTVIVWDLATGQSIATWYTDGCMSELAWAPERPIFLGGDDLGSIHILRMRVEGLKRHPPGAA